MPRTNVAESLGARHTKAAYTGVYPASGTPEGDQMRLNEFFKRTKHKKQPTKKHWWSFVKHHFPWTSWSDFKTKRKAKKARKAQKTARRINRQNRG